MPLPISYSETTRFSDAKWIDTRLVISQNGRLDVTMRVWSKAFLSGFTGGALIDLFDKEGNMLFRYQAPAIGVNGEAFGRSDVTKTYGVDLDPLIRDNVAQVDITNIKAPQDLGNLAAENIKRLEDLKKRLEGLRG